MGMRNSSISSVPLPPSGAKPKIRSMKSVLFSCHCVGSIHQARVTGATDIDQRERDGGRKGDVARYICLNRWLNVRLTSSFPVLPFRCTTW